MDLRGWITDQHANVLERLRSGVLRLVPHERWHDHVDDGGSSIAWLMLHLAVHQDLAVHSVVRGQPPLLASRRETLGLAEAPAWAGLPEAEDPAVSGVLDTVALERYVLDVHAATSTWLDAVPLAALDDVPPASERLAALGGVPAERLDWLHAMWQGKPAAWFVQWEAIGHGFTHVGEMVSVRNRMGLSPF